MILDILKAIESTDSTNEKLAILKANADNETLKNVYRMAYHPRLQYGIKKIPDYDNSRKLVDVELDSVLEFLERDLATRVLTGNTAIGALSQKLSALQPEDSEVVCRIIKRDLECGASATIANKVWKGLIPSQPQMLASSMSEKALSFIKFPAIAQLKADGARCFAEIRGDNIEDVKFLSRAGNEYKGLDNIARELIAATRSYRQEHGPVMVDGELVAVSRPVKNKVDLEDLFGDAQEVDEDFKVDQKNVVLRSESNGLANKSLKGTISKQEAETLSFQVWDLVPLNVVYDGQTSKKYTERFADLTSILKHSNRVLLIESTLVHNLDEAKAIYKKYVEQGLEGIILKNTFALWENKRSKNQVKFKEEIIIDLRVVSVQEHSKDPSKLGAVFLRSDDNLIRVKCGSGFTDTNAVKVKGEWVPIPYDQLDELNRSKLWLEQDDLIGTVVSIKCNGWIAAEGRTEYVSLFLPVIECLRRDKDETNTLEDMFPEALNVIEV
ncbi:DNA ligase [Acinetobacter phage AM101]|uniref:DNA ligase n=1 Tax=Acinetobacter phage AM101 TaxID=2178927 RepID=A0A4Y1NMH7_9CAUD|nr:DNA ligase [Acinetobacter phage AM101]AWY10234.1 DNA ligase [Acinetobacter phage AM101]